MISVITIALGCLSQNQGPLAHSSRKHVPYPDGLQAGEIWMITSGWQMGNWAKGSSWLAQGHGGATWVPWLSCHLEPRGWAGAVRTFQCELRDIHVAPITDPGPWFHFLNWRQQQDAGIFRLCSLQGMFLLKKKKKVCFSLRCQITERWEFCRNLAQFWLLTTSFRTVLTWF